MVSFLFSLAVVIKSDHRSPLRPENESDTASLGRGVGRVRCPRQGTPGLPVLSGSSKQLVGGAPSGWERNGTMPSGLLVSRHHRPGRRGPGAGWLGLPRAARAAPLPVQLLPSPRRHLHCPGRTVCLCGFSQGHSGASPAQSR